MFEFAVTKKKGSKTGRKAQTRRTHIEALRAHRAASAALGNSRAMQICAPLALIVPTVYSSCLLAINVGMQHCVTRRRTYKRAVKPRRHCSRGEI